MIGRRPLIDPRWPPVGPLIFASSWNGVTLTGSKGTYWTATLSGTDAETDYSWTDDLPNSASEFVTLYPSTPLSDAIVVEFVVGEGAYGIKRRLLHQQQKIYSQNEDGTTIRTEYEFKNDADDTLDEIYIRQWRRLQSNLSEVMTSTPGVWRQIFEAKEARDGTPDGRFRIYAQIVRNAAGNLVWTMAGEDAPFDDASDSRVWNYVSDIQVKPGRWQFLEIYIKHAYEDGRAVFKVDGETVAHYVGRTASSDSTAWRWISPFKLYLAKAAAQAGIHEQWIEKFALYSKAPRGFLIPGR